MVTGDSLKKEILNILMKDSRTSFRTIAKELKISTSTVSKIVKELEAAGVILAYTTIVDWHKLGYDSTLCLQISISPEADIDKVGNRLRGISAVKQVFYTTGEANFSAYAVCLDTSEATSILEELRKVKGIERVVPHTVLKAY
jgi:DNA-binding Lrp family transcriptional regulator